MTGTSPSVRRKRPRARGAIVRNRIRQLGRQKSTHVDNPVVVGRRLKAARESAGLSQRKLSFSGCSPAYISRIEAGTRIPSLQLLRALGERLGVSADYLAKGQPAGAGDTALLTDAEIALRLGDTDQASQLYEQALETATSDERRAKALAGLGELAGLRGEPAQAITMFEQALALTGSEPADDSTLAESLGRAHAMLGDLAQAIQLFRQCTLRFREEDDPVRYVRFACLLGYALTDAGEDGEAERVVADALEAGRSISDPYTRARLLWSRARLLGEQGKAEASAVFAQRALETLRLTEDTYAIAHAHQFLAQAYLDAGRVDEASEQLEAGRPLIESTATPLELALWEIEEARLLAARGDAKEAGRRAMAVTAKLGDATPADRGRAYVVLGGVFESVGDDARALEVYELAVEILAAQPPTRYLIDAQKRLASLLERAGRPDFALRALKLALAVQEQAGRPIS